MILLVTTNTVLPLLSVATWTSGGFTKARKSPHKAQSHKPGHFDSHFGSEFLSVLQGKIDDLALVGIWQQDRKIKHPVFDSVLLTSSVVICPDGKTLT